MAGEIKLKPNHYFTLVDVPYAYQKAAIVFLLKTPHAILGDATGLGKSLETIITFSYLKAKNPHYRALLLTEKSALLQWQKEFAWLTPGITTTVITADTTPDTKQRKHLFQTHNCDVLITTYSMVVERKMKATGTTNGYRDAILKGLGEKFVLICDEPNIFKNTRSKVHNSMRVIGRRAVRRYGLTAMIVENRLEETYGILKIIAPDIIPDKHYFLDNFCKTWDIGHVRIIQDYKNIPFFKKLIAPVYLRRDYDHPDVQQAIPEVQFQDIEVELNPEQSRLVNDAMQQLLTKPDGSVQNTDLLSSFTHQQKLVNNPTLSGHGFTGNKCDALVEYLSTQLQDERVVVFSKYRTFIDLLKEQLQNDGRKIFRITGQESVAQRRNAQLTFQDKTKPPCLLLMTSAGAKAINLQTGNYLVLADLPWSYGMLIQLIGRLRRTGSVHQHVHVLKFKALLASTYTQRETIDHYIDKVLGEKKKLIDAVNDGTEVLNSDIVRDVYVKMKGSYGPST